jgi:hypothetical protein
MFLLLLYTETSRFINYSHDLQVVSVTMHVPSRSGHHFKLVSCIGQPDSKKQFASAETITATTWTLLVQDNLSTYVLH